MEVCDNCDGTGWVCELHLEGHGLAPGSADAVERACPVLSVPEQMIQIRGPSSRSRINR